MPAAFSEIMGLMCPADPERRRMGGAAAEAADIATRRDPAPGGGSVQHRPVQHTADAGEPAFDHDWWVYANIFERRSRLQPATGRFWEHGLGYMLHLLLFFLPFDAASATAVNDRSCLVRRQSCSRPSTACGLGRNCSSRSCRCRQRHLPHSCRSRRLCWRQQRWQQRLQP